MDQKTRERRAGYSGDGARYDRLQLERAWSVPRESDELLSYGGHSAAEEDWTSDGLVEAVSHVVLQVSDLDRSEAWYQDMMGFDLLGRDLTAEELPHTVLSTNSGQLLVLVQTDSVMTEHPGHGGTHNAFTMTPNQYRRLVGRLRESGYDVVNIRAQMQAHGQYTVNITDPDDNKVEATCIGPEANDLLLSDAGVVDCGPAAKYKVGDIKPVKDGNFFLVRVKEGFLAISRWCRHMNGILIWQPSYWRFWCPFHGATYDRQGTCTGGQPNLPALWLHPITFSAEGHVLVNTGTVIDRDQYEAGQAVAPPATVATAAVPA